MKAIAKALQIFICLFLCLSSTQIRAQPPTPEIGQNDLALAVQLMISKRSVEAVAITSQLIEKLKENGEYDNPFGLKVRLVHGSALIHADTSGATLSFLWELKDASKTGGQWEVFAETCRVIASVLEYAGRKEQSLENLREAQTVICQYQLDSIYPHFAVRMSSWHRIFGDRDSSVYYANEAIRTAPLYGQVFEEAEGHLLLGMNCARADPAKAFFQYQEAARLYREIGEFSSFCSMQIGMAGLALLGGRPKEAMAFIDTAIYYNPLTQQNNIEQLHRAYLLKEDVFQQLGELDSAIFYLKIGHAKELEFYKKLTYAKIVEIDNKYSVGKKTEELDAKNTEFLMEKERLRWLAVLVLLVLFFSGVLATYYLKLRRANQKTNIQSTQLKNLDIAKSLFFANISHELRTPLTLVTGPINSLIKENRFTERQHRLLQMAARSGKQLEQLVNEILDLNKLEMGKMEVQAKPTELVPFFRKHLAQFESLADGKQVHFAYQLNIPNRIAALIDRAKCRQILNNLLSNAFKFTPTGGEILVKLEIGNWESGKHGPAIYSFPEFQITVTDSGPGIHPDDLPHVFDRFFQTNRPDRPAEGGTGIGLALCQEYANLFGGKIAVESQMGKGSTFRITFPVEVISKGNEPQAHENLTSQLASDYQVVKEKADYLTSTVTPFPNPIDPAKPTILVVEDNLELQDYIHLILQEKYNVVTAENGQVALDCLLSTVNCQLILSDLMMPVMDGYQLLEKLKRDEATRHIPVIMLTARAEAKDRLKALRIGVDDYLTKPFDEEELLVRIENLLANQAVRQEIASELEQKSGHANISQTDTEWLENFEAFAQKNLSNDIMSLDLLAQEFAMSKSTLLRQLKRLTGLSPIQYIQEMKLVEAHKLLENRTWNSVSKVASEVGFSDLRTFSRNFKKRFGTLPSKFTND